MAKKVSILKHLILMLVASGLVLLGIMWGLQLYTRHQTNIQVPALVGKDLGHAYDLLDRAGLRYEVIDSIFDKNKPAGTIAEVTPVAGSLVKPGRIIFVKSYSRFPARYALPYVKDMSERQARALLRGLGFDQIEERIVSGEHLGLCAGLMTKDGRVLEAGAMVPKETTIVMLITGIVRDSISMDDLLEEPSASAGSDSTRRVRKQSDEPTTNPEDWW